MAVASNRVLGIITKSNYWALDEYLGGEIEMVDVMFGSRNQNNTQFVIWWI